MTVQLRSEARKLRTTNAAAVVLLAAVGLTLFGVVLEGLSLTPAELAEEEEQRRMLGGGSVVVFFATLSGILTVTAEFRYGTIRPTLLFEPRRRVVLGAKLLASALAGAVFAVVCLALSVAVARSILAARDVDLTVSGAEMTALVLGTIVSATFGGMLGVAIGTLIRNQVGAVMALVGYAFLVDATLFAAAPALGRFLPGKAGDALAGQLVDDLLAPGVAAAVLVAWTLAFAAAAAVRSDRSDV